MAVKGWNITALFFVIVANISEGGKILKRHKTSSKTFANIVVEKRQYLSPDVFHLSPWGYQSHVAYDECNVNKPCPDEQYCDVHLCRKCRKEQEECHFIGTCCKGHACQYGRCTKGVDQGSPGTYCDKTKDCLGSSSCCVREITVNPHTSVCKPMLDEFESCGPINLFHQIYVGGTVEPACGPCKTGLQCKNVGIKGQHFICLQEEES